MFLADCCCLYVAGVCCCLDGVRLLFAVVCHCVVVDWCCLVLCLVKSLRCCVL